MSKFTKWFEWTKKNEDLTQNGMLLICVLIERWEFNKRKPFHCTLKWLGEQIKVKKDDTVLKAINNLTDLNLISIEKRRESGNKGKNYYSINQEILDKLSGEQHNSTPTVKEEPREQFNKFLLEFFDDNKDYLMSNDKQKVEAFLNKFLDKNRSSVELFGTPDDYKANFNNVYKQWHQKQNDLKSQVI